MELQVRLSATIDYTKLLIEERAGNPPDEQRLIYKGKQLEDGRTLQEYGFQDLDTLHLVTRLRGGVFLPVRIAALLSSFLCSCNWEHASQYPHELPACAYPSEILEMLPQSG